MVFSKRPIWLAIALAFAGVVAIPDGKVGAASAPTAVISFEETYQSTRERDSCSAGPTRTLYAKFSKDPDGGSLTYEWTATKGGSVGDDPSTFEYTCDWDGANVVTLRVVNAAGLDNSVSVTLHNNLRPTAVMTVDGGPITNILYVPVGDSITLSAESSSDPENQPLTYQWWFDQPPSVEIDLSDQSKPTLTIGCGEEAQLLLAVTVTDELLLDGSDFTTVICTYPSTGEFTPAPPASGKRTVIPIGTTITFKQLHVGCCWRWLEWRTTGVAGVAGKWDEFTRTFNELGDFGVELTEISDFDRGKSWAGYTVIGPPTVSVTPAPAKPTDRLTVMQGSTVTFDGSGSRSPGGGSLQYQWLTTGTSGVAGDGVRFARKFDRAGNFGVELTVINELGQRAKQWVGVTVKKSEPPVVSVTPAPADPTKRMKVTLGSTVNFDGSRSTDPDGGQLTFEWRTTGVRGVASPDKSFHRTFGKVGNYGVELTVIDDEGQRSKRWVGITVVN